MSDKILITVDNEPLIDIFTKKDESGAPAIQKYIDKIKEHTEDFYADVETRQGREDITSMAYKVSRSKTYLDDKGKEIAAEMKEIPKKIDATRRDMREQLDNIRDNLRAPLVAYQEREAEKKERNEGLLNQISQAKQFCAMHWDTGPIEVLNEKMSFIKAIPDESDDFAEYAERIKEEKRTGLVIVENAILRREKADQQAAEIARLQKIEAEKAAKEREEAQAAEKARIAKEREERAALEAEIARLKKIESAQIEDKKQYEEPEQKEPPVKTPTPDPLPKPKNPKNEKLRLFYLDVAQNLSDLSGLDIESAKMALRPIAQGSIKNVRVILPEELL